jgi:hypothetical protein
MADGRSLDNSYRMVAISIVCIICSISWGGDIVSKKIEEWEKQEEHITHPKYDINGKQIN